MILFLFKSLIVLIGVHPNVKIDPVYSTVSLRNRKERRHGRFN